MAAITALLNLPVSLAQSRSVSLRLTSPSPLAVPTLTGARTVLLAQQAIAPAPGIAQVQKNVPAIGVSEHRCFLALIGYVDKLAAALGVVNGKKVLDLDILAAIVRALDNPNSDLSTGEKQWLAHEHQYQGFLELLIEFTNPARKGAAPTFNMQQRLRQRFFKWLDGAVNLPHWKQLKTARWTNYEKCVSSSLDCGRPRGKTDKCAALSCHAIRFFKDRSAFARQRQF